MFSFNVVWLPTIVPLRESVGVFEMKLITPPIALSPYKVDPHPFIISTCCKSRGGILKTPNDPENPSYSGSPSLIILVYLLSKP